MLGCYQWQTWGDRLDSLDSMTIAMCLEHCREKEAPFAGLDKGKKCICNSELPAETQKRDEEDCSSHCTGEPGTAGWCGGHKRMTAYSVHNNP